MFCSCRRINLETSHDKVARSGSAQGRERRAMSTWGRTLAFVGATCCTLAMIRQATLSLRKLEAPMLWRAGQGVALQLPRLPEAHRFTVQRRSLLSPRGGRIACPRHPKLPAAFGERLCVTFHSCAICRSNRSWEPERMPHLVGVASAHSPIRTFRCRNKPYGPKTCQLDPASRAMPAYSRDPPPKAAVHADPAPE